MDNGFQTDIEKTDLLRESNNREILIAMNYS